MKAKRLHGGQGRKEGCEKKFISGGKKKRQRKREREKGEENGGVTEAVAVGSERVWKRVESSDE